MNFRRATALALFLFSLAAAGVLTRANGNEESFGHSRIMATETPENAPAVGAREETIIFGMGCFWGAEKRMAKIDGVIDVESGYANGEVAGTYRAVLAQEQARREGRSTLRNHAEVVRIRFDPARIPLTSLLRHFWENHDPTQGDRQGNDVGSNYRSAIYTQNAAQQTLAQESLARYQAALTQAGYGTITTEIAPLTVYFPAETEHQDYLLKNPRGYCGLGGTGVPYPGGTTFLPAARPLPGETPLLTGGDSVQLIVFEAVDCPFCRRFEADILAHWQADIPLARTASATLPPGWTLEKPLFATPTTVLFKQQREASRYTGYDGDRQRFWAWLGHALLSPEQQAIAFRQGTERPFTGAHLDEKRPGRFVDPVSGATLFRSNAKFDSGTGWPSFFIPDPGAITEHEDTAHGLRRIEVRSASSGIHLGHVFDDGPPPTYKRYCINGNVLKFVPDTPDPQL